MPRKLKPNKAVKWLSEEMTNVQNMSSTFHYYGKFQFKKIVGELDEFVLISNADAAEPDTEAGCDVARIVSLYEDTANSKDPFRAKVQWYSRHGDLPSSCFNNMESVEFLENEVLEDHRPFDSDISIETIFKKCSVTLTFTDRDPNIKAPFHYICRYRVIAVSKRKVQIEPVMEAERSNLTLLSTPVKRTAGRTPRTPNSLTKNMNRMSLSDWSISKNEGSKLLLKRAIQFNKNTNSPKNVTPKPKMKPSETPESTKKPTKNTFEEILSMELQEGADGNIPILVITTTPKRKSIVHSKTPEKVLEHDKESYCTKSGRKVRCPANNFERQSPVMSTPSKTYRQEDSPVTKTPQKSNRKVKDHNDMKEILSIELQEHSDEEIPTPPKKKTETGAYYKTPTKVSVFENYEKESSTRSRRVTRCDVNNSKQETTPFKNRPTRRSTRLSINYLEESPVEKTPQKVIHALNDDSEDDFVPAPKTPKTPKTKTPRTPRASSVKTPQRVKRINISQLTPTLHARAHSVEEVEDFLNEDKSLPGRETELREILCFVRSKLHSGTSGCMYISGVPGTGKTATVCSALKILKEEADLPDFHLVEVNGMKIAEPRQAYVHIYKQLTDKSVVWEQACSLLEKRFTSAGPRRVPTVLLVDELDALCNRKQDVIYSIMEWATHDSALLTVLAVANTMDLPERVLAARVASRLGLTRLSFQPYTHAQLQRIVALRLAGAAVGLHADAMQLIARKVAAVSGDARRALSLCARALELAAAERAARGAGAGAAGLQHVQAALAQAAAGALVRVIQHCSPAEQLLLRAMAAEVERTGTDETTLTRVLDTAGTLMAVQGRPYRCAPNIRAPTPSQAHAIFSCLNSMRLVIMEPKPTGAKLLLNVSVDDVYYATKQMI